MKFTGIPTPDGYDQTKLLKALLELELRISVKFKVKNGSSQGEILEYQFVKDQKNPNSNDLFVSCVYCKSVTQDLLRLCGVTTLFAQFSTLLLQKQVSGNNSIFLEKVSTSIFPYDWYECFEKENSPKWNLVEEKMGMIQSVIDEETKKESLKLVAMKKEEEERQKAIEVQRQKYEEEMRKREESRRQMEQLQKFLANMDDDPRLFEAFMKEHVIKK